MAGKKQVHQPDPKEFELPETTYSHEIENRVFRDIIFHVLSQTPGIGLHENFLGTLIGRADSVKGITIDQDLKTRSVHITLEIQIQYGMNIPQTAEDIQTRVSDAIMKMTGMRVGSIHIIFKELMLETPSKDLFVGPKVPVEINDPTSSGLEHEFS